MRGSGGFKCSCGTKKITCTENEAGTIFHVTVRARAGLTVAARVIVKLRNLGESEVAGVLVTVSPT